MKDLKLTILTLAEQLDKYSGYLGSQNKRSLDLHSLPNLARSPQDGVSTRLKHIPGRIRTELIKQGYAELEKCLLNTELYIPVSLVDFYPSDR